MQFMNNIFL